MVCRMVEMRGALCDLEEGFSLHPRGPGLSEADGLSESFAELERYGPFFGSSIRRTSTEPQANVSFTRSAFEETIELLARCIPQSYTDEVGMFFFAHRLKSEIERCKQRWRRVCIKFQVSSPRRVC